MMHDGVKNVREEAKIEGRVSNVKRMLEFNIPPNTIAKYLCITDEEVKQYVKD